MDNLSLRLNGENKNACMARLCHFGYGKSAAKEESRRHIHSTLEIFYFEKGEGVVEIGQKVFPVKAHDLFIVDSSKLHIQYCKEKSVPLVFYGFEVDEIALAGFNKNSITLNGYFYCELHVPDNPVRQQILRLMDEVKKKEYNYLTKIQLLFNELFIDLLRLVFAQTPKLVEGTGGIVNVQALEIAKAYIDERYAESISVEDLSTLTFMSKSYFITQFKTFFQITPKQYVNLVRIQRACALLTSTDDSVMKIACQVGFSNPVYFTEIFTKINKLTPSKYRQKYGEKETKGE